MMMMMTADHPRGGGRTPCTLSLDPPLIGDLCHTHNHNAIDTILILIQMTRRHPQGKQKK